jgi:hypothetical protein
MGVLDTVLITLILIHLEVPPTTLISKFAIAHNPAPVLSWYRKVHMVMI